jgi:hypothetical protein
MFFTCKRTWLVVAVTLLGAAATGRAQEFQPFGPIEFGNISDMQLFAPPDLSTYGDYHPNTGPWFSYERLYWTISHPGYALIGTPDNPGLSDNSNQFIGSNWVWGNRFEFGYWLESNDDNGWMATVLKTNDQQAKPLMNGITHVGFLNAAGVPVQVTFPANGEFTNVTRMTGVELLKTYRYDPDDRWGIWEMYYGARFLQVHDRFSFSNPFTDTPGPGQDQFSLGIDNNIVGPEIGTRWSNKRGRWTFDSQVRFMAGANFEDSNEYGAMATGTFPLHNFYKSANNVEFAPVGEFRVDATYQLSKSFALKVGYTAIAMTGIGRSSQRIDYQEPDLGIIDGNTRDHLFANGLTFGFEFNH